MNEAQFYPQINNRNYNQNQSIYPSALGTLGNQNRTTQYPAIVGQERMHRGNINNSSNLGNMINLNTGSSRQNQQNR